TVHGSRLTPAFISPVATIIGKYAGEVAHKGHSRSRKRSAGVGIDPGVAAVGGAKEVVGVVMREASPAFIDASNVYVAGHQVAGDLHVTDEGAAIRDLVR